MRRLWLLLGVGIGFILGSRAGREPYERVQTKLRQVSRRPEVKDAVDQISGQAEDVAETVLSVANDKVDDVSDKVQAKTKATVK